MTNRQTSVRPSGTSASGTSGSKRAAVDRPAAVVADRAAGEPEGARRGARGRHRGGTSDSRSGTRLSSRPRAHHPEPQHVAASGPRPAVDHRDLGADGQHREVDDHVEPLARRDLDGLLASTGAASSPPSEPIWCSGRSGPPGTVSAEPVPARVGRVEQPQPVPRRVHLVHRPGRAVDQHHVAEDALHAVGLDAGQRRACPGPAPGRRTSRRPRRTGRRSSAAARDRPRGSGSASSSSSRTRWKPASPR